MWEGDARQPSRDDPDHRDTLGRSQVKQGGQGGGDDHGDEVRGDLRCEATQEQDANDDPDADGKVDHVGVPQRLPQLAGHRQRVVGRDVHTEELVCLAEDHRHAGAHEIAGEDRARQQSRQEAESQQADTSAHQAHEEPEGGAQGRERGRITGRQRCHDGGGEQRDGGLRADGGLP